jgi:hypothetical protein
MANVSNLKPLVKEDYPSQYHDLIDKLAFSLNPLMFQLASAFNKSINFDNLSQRVVDFNVTVDPDGIPLVSTKVKVDGKFKIYGTVVIKVQNLTDTTELTTPPFITYTTSGNLLTVTHITGLAANKNYKVSALLLI